MHAKFLVHLFSLKLMTDVSETTCEIAGIILTPVYVYFELTKIEFRYVLD
jgi:hypothetical protein